jgi:transcriptional regulator GlxA family with amidase domain
MDELAPLVGRTTQARVVPQGKIVTAAGVSAGIDMALWLVGQIAGDEVAKAIQLGIEYDPQPPYDAGSPAKAGPDLVALLRDMAIDRQQTQAGAAG